MSVSSKQRETVFTVAQVTGIFNLASMPVGRPDALCYAGRMTVDDVQQNPLIAAFEGLVQSNRDGLVFVPQGRAWFEVISPETLLRPRGLMVVIYPTESLMRQQMARFESQGYRFLQDFAALHIDLPPHMVRMVWENVHARKLPILMLTAAQFQSASILSQLVQHPGIGPVIIDSAHLGLPHLWGPTRYGAYENLGMMLQTQWARRPQVIALSAPLPGKLQSQLASYLGLAIDNALHLPVPDHKVWLTVQPALTLSGKWQFLKKHLKSERVLSGETVTVVVAHSAKGVHDVVRRLGERACVAYHHHLDSEERELAVMELVHRPDRVLVVESVLLGELPLHLLPTAALSLILWQMPWSLPSLMQSVWPALGPQTVEVDVTLMATRGDFARQERWITHQVADEHQESVWDNLNSVRRFLQYQGICRRVQLDVVYLGPASRSIPCGHCEQCERDTVSPISSLWRNLSSRLRF